MSGRLILVTLLVATLLVTAVLPAPAEANMLVVGAIIGAAVLVVLVVGYLVVANMEDRRRAEVSPSTEEATLLAYEPAPQPSTP